MCLLCYTNLCIPKSNKDNPSTTYWWSISSSSHSIFGTQWEFFSQLVCNMSAVSRILSGHFWCFNWFFWCSCCASFTHRFVWDCIVQGLANSGDNLRQTEFMYVVLCLPVFGMDFCQSFLVNLCLHFM